MGYNQSYQGGGHKKKWQSQSSHNNDVTYDKINGTVEIKDWVNNRITKDTIQFADAFGKALSRGLSTSQIRKIYGEVKKLQMNGWDPEGKTESSLLLLKAQLAYAAKRAGGKAVELKQVLCKGIDAVVDAKNPSNSLDNFSNIFEAILAYHKSYGGK